MKDKQLELIEHAIGEVFEYNGMDLKVVEGTPCTGCYQLDMRIYQCRLDGSEIRSPHAQCCENYNKK